jgi:hypothetical protein
VALAALLLARRVLLELDPLASLQLALARRFGRGFR